MAKNITSSIRLRADTITNWILNRTTVLPLNELSIIKFDDGSISLKLGNGSTYAATDFVKFQNLCVTSITDGTNTFSMPASTGTLALTSQVDGKVDKITGKGLSTNDYTTPEKEAVATISDKVDKVTGSSLVPDVKVALYDDHINDADIHVTSTDKANWNNKVDKNSNITAATKCKITYDTKGLVTAGADLTATDIPSLAASKITSGTFSVDRIPTLAQSKITNLTTDLASKVDKVTGSSLVPDTKVSGYDLHVVDNDIHVTTSDKTSWNNKIDKNAAITAATKCKITYDTKGLVTAGADLTATDIPSLPESKITNLTTDLASKVDKETGKGLSTEDYTTEEKTKLSTCSIVAETGSKIDLEMDTTEYKLVAKLYDKNDTLISTSTVIDLPLEQIIVSITFDSASNELVITLKNGSVVRVPIGSIVSGLATQSYVDTEVAKKVTKNSNITAATKCKITYDAKGLVTAGADLTATDIPSLAASKITSGTFSSDRIPTLDQSKITNLTTDLASKVDKVTGSSLVPDTKVSGYDTHVADTTIHVTSTDKSNWNNKVTQNTAITGATKCKITYDTKGLVTAGADLTATDIPSLAASKITSGTFDAARIPTLDQSKISGLSTALNNKVDKVSGKGLSTNDYTTEEKSKLAGLSNYDDSQVRALIQSLTAALQSEVAERNLMEQRLIAYVDEKTSNAIDNVLNASYGN